MLHKFRVKNNGTIFYVDNHSNVLYDKNKVKLSRNVDGFMDKPNTISDVYKGNQPAEIKIILGQSCNYSCGYCVQRDIGDHTRKVKHFDPQLLIDRMKNTLDLSILDQIELWGGETLLYWEEIKPIMLAFDKEEFDFVIPTNGTVLKEEHIDFFASLKGRVTIELSHDGPKHAEIRGVDFLPRIVPVLKKIEQYPEKMRVEMSVTITNQSYDLNVLNDYFRDFYKEHAIQPIPLIFRPVWAYDSLSKKFSLDEVLTDYKSVLNSYLNRQINQFKASKQVVDDEMIQSQLFHINLDDDENNGILQMASNFRIEMARQGSTVCGMHVDDHLTIDNMGNIRACQNVGDNVFNGNILDFINNPAIKVNGITVKNLDACKRCPVYSYCLSGCPLDLSQEMFDTNCKINFSHHLTMLLASLKLLFGDEVEWLGLDDE